MKQTKATFSPNVLVVRKEKQQQRQNYNQSNPESIFFTVVVAISMGITNRSQHYHHHNQKVIIILIQSHTKLKQIFRKDGSHVNINDEDTELVGILQREL